MDEVAIIYNNLLRFESRYAKGEPYPVHRKLQLPFGYHDMLDWLASEIDFSIDDFVLDSGCGNGFTLFYLHNRFGLKGVGISISNEEVAYAREACSNKKIENMLQFEIEDYQVHRSGPYSKIICIESLKHARHLNLAIRNLIENLKANGKIIIIDDFINLNNRHIEKQKELWNSPGFANLESYQRIIKSVGSFKYNFTDLTPFVPVRKKWLLTVLILISTFIITLTSGLKKRNMKSYLGGLMLEKQYAEGQIKYICMIVERNKI